jgi:hypothetical protein
VISERTFEIKISLGSLKTERVLACLIQLSKNKLPVWQESNSGFRKCNTGTEDVKVKNANLQISTKSEFTQSKTYGIRRMGPKNSLPVQFDAIKGCAIHCRAPNLQRKRYT